MRKRDEDFLRMAAATFKILTNNQNVWSDNIVANPIITSINEDINSVSEALKGVIEGSKGASSSKEQAAELAINQTLKLSRLTQVYAISHNDLVLANKMQLSESLLRRLPDQQLAAALETIADAILKFQPELVEYGITEDEYSKLKRFIDDYENNKDQPRLVITDRKSQNKSIVSLINELRLSFYKLDRLMGIWEDEHVKFANDYKTARIVIDLGNRSSSKVINTEGPDVPGI
nr:hypothetical protein [Pedobacter sp. ASV2]